MNKRFQISDYSYFSDFSEIKVASIHAKIQHRVTESANKQGKGKQ